MKNTISKNDMLLRHKIPKKTFSALSKTAGTPGSTGLALQLEAGFVFIVGWVSD
jgi:hypothetical protein